ncbi:MAG: CYTH domain-containing protein [bacterium]|nr:CYTH domain-containing protein [Bacilli bacterium]MDD7081188.1 CYTH domain-containing protein [bacterium]MDY2896249.1 CYTH domain-containing protein [Candidatus Enterosoma sp.]MDD7093096.1 CYTH domain-containing protein [bacterium]MDD7328436.1 CYTH domain-containing protein [bacterium]
MSSNNIEIEAKVLLSKKDYERLLANIPFNPQVKVQENYFLDSEDRELKKYGMLVRLRRREGRNKLTMKAPLSEGLLDKSQMLTDEETNALLENNIFPRGDILDFLEILHIDSARFQVLAELTTERYEGIYEGFEINISKNIYSGTVDYELECDSDSAFNSQNTLRSLCDHFDIKYEPNVLSKETRAINAAQKAKQK